MIMQWYVISYKLARWFLHVQNVKSQFVHLLNWTLYRIGEVTVTTVICFVAVTLYPRETSYWQILWLGIHPVNCTPENLKQHNTSYSTTTADLPMTKNETIFLSLITVNFKVFFLPEMSTAMHFTLSIIQRCSTRYSYSYSSTTRVQIWSTCTRTQSTRTRGFGTRTRSRWT